MLLSRRTLPAAATAALLLLGACASSPDRQAAGYCPTGEERICRKDVSRVQSTGARLGSKKVCRCEPVAADDVEDAT